GLTALGMLVSGLYLLALFFILIAYLISPLFKKEFQYKLLGSLGLFFSSIVVSVIFSDSQSAPSKDITAPSVIEVSKQDSISKDKKPEPVSTKKVSLLHAATMASKIPRNDRKNSSKLSRNESTQECQLSGKVISIIDGDTLTVLDTHNKEKHKIRLEGVDAPEPRQPFAKKAKKYLSALVKNKTVCINWHKQDKFGRKIAKILIDGVDINYKMVNKGLAWHYKVDEKEQSIEDRKKFSAAQTDARLAVIGLWSEPDPIAPWKWRKGNRPISITKVSSKHKPTKKTAKKNETHRNKPTRKKASASKFSCSGKRFCRHMGSCAEAYFYLNQCGLGRLDRDKDGIPCESICR
ncbi:MAG: thermonuclease family protein, partial [Thiotrichaceae bacterium]